MSLEDEDNYQNSIDCCICNQKIINNKDKVKYHCYVTGKYKCAVHIECKKIPRRLPIIYHNLKGYDVHLIFRELNNFKDIDIQVNPKTNERYYYCC